MVRIVGQPNKLNTEVKEKLQTVMDNVVLQLDVNSMTTDRKIAIIKLETGQRLVDILGKKEEGKYTHPPLSINAFTENEDGSYTARFRQEKTGALVNLILCERAVEVVKTGL